MKRGITIFFALAFAIVLEAQPAFVQSVLLENDTVSSPGYFTLRWNSEAGATQYRIFRKSPGDNSWGGGPLAILEPDVNSWTDSSVQKGEVYEYRVQKLASGYTGYGYMTSGVNLEHVEDPGRVLILVEQELETEIRPELEQMVEDLSLEGWQCKVEIVSAGEEPEAIKENIIKAWHDLDRESAKGLILVGHIPVAYSGSLAPDGHTDHQGAWPADGYYGELDGNWPDWQVNNTAGNQTRHHNVPGDGKFDPSAFPSDIDIWVGRIDFAKLPAFPETEAELTRKYLAKLHQFKTAQFRAVPRGLLEDNFGNFQEGFSQNAWKNFSPIVGVDSVKAMDYRTTLLSGSYMFSYGCGGGNYRGASGISNTNNMAVDSLQTIFTMLFGSYFGDWDSNDNFLRSALASGTTLTNMWAGRPHWQIHPMGLGSTIGDCALLSMNNRGVYVTGFGARGVHMALMGDPTLQWYYVKPPSDLVITEAEHRLRLEWQASEDEVMGYHIYRKRQGDTKYQRINQTLLTETTFMDSCLVAGETYAYMVRAMDLVQSASGSYYRLSLGAGQEFSPVNDFSLISDFSVSTAYENISINNLSENATGFSWSFGDGTTSDLESPEHNYGKRDSIFDAVICLKTVNRCFEDEKCDTLAIMGSLPRLENIEAQGPRCNRDSTVMWSALLAYEGAEPLLFSQEVTRNGDELNAELVLGKGVVTVTNALGDQLNYGPYVGIVPVPIERSYDVKNPTPGNQDDGEIALTDVTGGIPPYSVMWSTGSTENRITGLAPGIYWVDVTDDNACTERDSFELKRTTSVIDRSIEGISIYPNPFSDQLTFEDKQGSTCELLLRDLNGRLIARWKIEKGHRKVISMPSQLAPSVYFLTVMTDTEEATYRLTKVDR